MAISAGDQAVRRRALTALEETVRPHHILVMTETLDARSLRYDLDDDDAHLSPDDAHKKPTTDRSDQAKMRACLICKRRFLSAWAGERVCRQCKSTSGWRGGVL